MLKFTDEQLGWLLERIPNSPRSSLGGWPTAGKRRIVRGIFWMLDKARKGKTCRISSARRAPPIAGSRNGRAKASSD